MNSQIDDDRDVLIECRDVHKSFGEKHVLRGVSFKVSPSLSAFIGYVFHDFNRNQVIAISRNKIA